MWTIKRKEHKNLRPGELKFSPSISNPLHQVLLHPLPVSVFIPVPGDNWSLCHLSFMAMLGRVGKSWSGEREQPQRHLSQETRKLGKSEREHKRCREGGETQEQRGAKADSDVKANKSPERCQVVKNTAHHA